MELKKRELYIIRGAILLGALILLSVSSRLYFITSEMMSQGLREKITSIAITGAVAIDPYSISNLNKQEDWETEDWKNVVSVLADIEGTNSNIVFSYIFRRSKQNPNQLVFVADSHSINPYANIDSDPTNDVDANGDGKIDANGPDYLQWPGQIYEDPPEAAFNAFELGESVSGLYEDDFGRVITAYAPIHEPDGSISILAVDMRADDYLFAAKQAIIPFAIFISILIIVIFALVAVILKVFNDRLKVLKKVDQQKNEFLSFATHQLKSPLTAMKWGMETLKDMNFAPEEVEQRKVIVNKLYDTTNDLIRTVGDLLDISKIEQGGLVLKKEPFDWFEYTQKIAEEFRIPANVKGLDLIVEIPSTPVIINGDQTKLRQVLVNIIDNAIKYTPTGTVTVTAILEGDFVTIRVSDTGPGIEAEELTKLFNKFARGMAGKSSGNAGSGLGLFLVKKIMELHNGDVWAESEGAGSGSCFCVKLPVLSEVSDKISQ
jgi:signal transduction histidine kinase